ncbi:MAG: phosphatase PAP2 family protein [Bacteroidetes bacterium]|nr:phosphatase PAP2 family protein [Bacteroidota bacterium]
MIDHIVQFDRHLFHFINYDLGNSFFDWLMPVLRNAKSWIPLYIVIICLCLWKYKKQGVIIVIFIALSAGLADYTSARLFKQEVKRLRPCNDTTMADVKLRINGCGTGYSFPSTHATDHFAMAIFMCFVFYKRWRWVWLWAILWAASISFAQVYVGVHFPVDVFVGALYGSFIGWLMWLLFKKIQPKS